jgi:Adenosine deaminase
MDRRSLRDAIHGAYAAALLRSPDAFYEAQMRINSDGIEKFVRHHAERLRRTTSATYADVEWAFEEGERKWSASRPHGKTSRIVSVLWSYSRSVLLHDGSEMTLRVDEDDPGREILRWRYMSLAVPAGILISAATPMGIRPASAVRLLNRAMVPDGPVAHQHVHHAAMLSFEELWASIRMRALLRPGRYFEAFANKNALCPGLHRGRCIGGRAKEDRALGRKYEYARRKHLIEWGAMVRLAFAARGLMARHLRHALPLAQCAKCGVERRHIAALTYGRTLDYSETSKSYPWPDEVLALRRLDRENDKRRKPENFASHLASQEQMFLVRALNHVQPEAVECDDTLFEKVLLQYLRVKTAVFGLLVHPPGEPGLDNFLDHFSQIKVYAPEADRATPRVPEEPGLDVRATEYRVAPDAWFGHAHRRSPIEGLESGYLIHFKRKRPDDNAIPLHGLSVRSIEAEADQIMRHLEAEPRKLTILRGIDICGVEEHQPCWVAADTLRRLRQKSEKIVARSGRRNLQPLRLTLHAGEDFRWLTTGVRAIAEPFAWKLLRRGDRIGHGIAITLDPKRWWERKSGDVIHVTRFDSFLNLAFLAAYVRDGTRDQREWLRDSITTIVRDLRLDMPGNRSAQHSTDDDVVEVARRFWLDLGTAALRRIMAAPDKGAAAGRRHLLWLHRYLWNRSVHEYANTPVARRLESDRGSLPIASDHNELDLLVRARKQIIRDLARWQISIEANPSSNLVVGGFESMLAQDFLYRRPAIPAEDIGDETLTWTISTDDPITFSTTLADEYAYAWAGMVLREDKQYDPAYARALLDEAAATSMRTRFTISPNDFSSASDRSKRRSRRY